MRWKCWSQRADLDSDHAKGIKLKCRRNFTALPCQAATSEVTSNGAAALHGGLKSEINTV